MARAKDGKLLSPLEWPNVAHTSKTKGAVHTIATKPQEQFIPLLVATITQTLLILKQRNSTNHKCEVHPSKIKLNYPTFKLYISQLYSRKE